MPEYFLKSFRNRRGEGWDLAAALDLKRGRAFKWCDVEGGMRRGDAEGGDAERGRCRERGPGGNEAHSGAV